MEIRKNGKNGPKIRKVGNLTLHNTELHITLPPSCQNPPSQFKKGDAVV